MLVDVGMKEQNQDDQKAVFIHDWVPMSCSLSSHQAVPYSAVNHPVWP